MHNLYNKTMKHLSELNIETGNRDTAAVTFDAMQLLEEQKNLIVNLNKKIKQYEEKGRVQHQISMSQMSLGSGDR
jgi:hypothetical protein